MDYILLSELVKVLFLANRIPFPPFRGDKLKIYNLARRLAVNHSLYLVTFVQDKEDLKYRKELEKIFEEALRGNRTLESIVAGQTDETEQIMDLLNKYDAEWHKKFTLAISCILLFFIGAPLGSIIRKGGFGMPLVISILMFIVYFIINVIGEKLAKEGVLDTFTGMWLSTFILLPIAIFLTYKASTDSKLFDADSYKAFFRKLTRPKS